MEEKETRSDVHDFCDGPPPPPVRALQAVIVYKLDKPASGFLRNQRGSKYTRENRVGTVVDNHYLLLALLRRIIGATSASTTGRKSSVQLTTLRTTVSFGTTEAAPSRARLLRGSRRLHIEFNVGAVWINGGT